MNFYQLRWCTAEEISSAVPELAKQLPPALDERIKAFLPGTTLAEPIYRYIGILAWSLDEIASTPDAAIRCRAASEVERACSILGVSLNDVRNLSRHSTEIAPFFNDLS
jgi:hypothetical protein